MRRQRWLLRGVLGTLTVALVFMGLFGLDFLLGVDLRVFGVSDAATQARVVDRYGRLIVHHQITLLALAAGYGAAIGAVLQIALGVWERSGAWPRRRPQHSAETPVQLVPSPWSLRRRLGVSALLGLGVHTVLLARAIATRPALFTETLYDRGGSPRALMVWLTHGAGLVLIQTIALVVALFLLLAPLLSARGREALTDWWATRRRALLGGLFLLALVVAGGVYFVRQPATPPGRLPPREAPPASAGAPKPPSVLVIAVDSLRADRVGPEARRVAPAIADLAARGVRFTSAHVTVPRTFPSFVTLLTGRYPFRHGVRTMFPTVAERAQASAARPLPARLREAGYRTAVISDFCGEIFSRIDLGFDHVEVPPLDARTLVRQRSVTVHKNLLPYVQGAIGQRVFPELGSLAELSDPQRLADATVARLRTFRDSGQPFFTVVFFSTAHFPYAAPAPYYRRFTDPNYQGPFRYHKPPLESPQTAADVTQVRALYDGAVAATDDGVRRLLDGLRGLGLDRDTIVVLLADHGENLYDEPGRGMGHGDHLEGDSSLRVPLLVVDPVHRFPAHAVPGLVRDLDLVPTLLGLIGLPLERELDGVSLLPMLTGERTSLGLTSFSETELWFTPSGPGFTPDQRLPYPDVTATTDVDPQDDIAVAERYRDLVTVAKHRALRTERWKLIYRPTRQGPRYSLYDVQADPEERHDLEAEKPEELSQMKAELFRLLAQDPQVVVEQGYVLPR